MWKLIRTLKYHDISLLLAIGLLVSLGLAVMYASSLANPSLSIFYRQLIFAVVGIALYFFAASYSYHRLAKGNRIFYIVVVLVLLFVLLFGRSIRGSSRWIDFGFFRFQPAEFAKIVVTLGLARWLFLRRGEINSFKNI